MADSADDVEESPSKWKFWQWKAPSNGFPLGNLGTTSDDPTVRYTHAMYSTGHGFASQYPPSYTSPKPWRNNGAMIGDVGYFDMSRGAFQYLFNIFHDEKGPDDLPTTFPDNFVPIKPPLTDWEVRATPDFFAVGATIVSEGVQVTRKSEEEMNFTFSCPVKEGAILVLPKGGSREDLVVTDALYDYISGQALEWFQFRDGYRKDILSVKVANGNLYLVTGVDKASEWSTLCCWKKPKDSKEDPLEVDYNYSSPQPWDISERKGYNISTGHWGKDTNDGHLSTPFVRGLRIALSPTAWEDYLPTDISDPIYHIPTDTPSDTTTVSPSIFVRSLRKSLPENLEEVPFHPSLVVIQMALSKASQLLLLLSSSLHIFQIPKKRWPKLVVVDDALWCPFVQGKYLNWAVTVDLIAHIFKMNKIVLNEGIMYLAPKGSDGSAGQAESILQRLLSYLSEDVQHRAEVYLTTREIKKAVKLVVFEKKTDDD